MAAAAGFAGYYLNQSVLRAPPATEAAQRLMLAPLTDLSGKPQTLSRWRGKVLIVNFWATWCTPCREEIPELMKIQEKQRANGVEIVGIAIDNASKVRDYGNEMHINYSLLVGGAETLAISRDLGNQAGVLPFTVVMGRSGNVAFVHAGALTEAALGPVLAKLL